MKAANENIPDTPADLVDNPVYQLPAELDATPHPVVEAEQRAGQIVSRVMQGVSAMLHEHMAGVKLELRAITNDNSRLRQNLSVLNEALGKFQIEQVLPLRDALATLNQEQTSVVVENGRKLEQLIQALANSIDAAGGLIPEDLKAQIKDGRFENLKHTQEGDLVALSKVQDMVEEAYARGLRDAKSHPNEV